MENCGICRELSRCMCIAAENGVSKCIHFSEVKKFMDALSSSVENDETKHWFLEYRKEKLW